MTIPKYILNVLFLSLPALGLAIAWWLLSPTTFMQFGYLASAAIGLLIGLGLMGFVLGDSEWFWRPTILTRDREHRT